MQQILAFLFVLGSFHPFAHATEWTDQKARSTEQLLSIVTQLSKIARVQTAHYPEGSVEQHIDKLVGQVGASEDLVRLALICHAITGSGDASHVSYDGVFDYVTWHCARLLSQRPGRAVEFALARLQPVIGRDGGASLMMRELMEAQKKLPTAPQE